MNKEVASKIPRINSNRESKSDSIIYSHLFGIIGDWYICEISEDLQTAYGFKSVSSEKEWEMDSWIKNGKDWEEFSIKDLQNLVNEKFLKEQDIRFLIVRDIYWDPTKFSSIDTENATLNYPGRNY
tara:strand:- start:444 stop:821 length:378 start_codon:yes stop_codon:yes gene_type:complete